MRPDLTYHAFCLFVAVAPSRSRKPLPVLDFTDRVQELVETMFPGLFPDGPEYAGPELVRYQGVSRMLHLRSMQRLCIQRGLSSCDGPLLSLILTCSAWLGALFVVGRTLVCLVGSQAASDVVTWCWVVVLRAWWSSGSRARGFRCTGW